MAWLLLAGRSRWRRMVPPNPPVRRCRAGERPDGPAAAGRIGHRGRHAPTSAPTGASWRSSRWLASPPPTSTRWTTSTSSIATTARLQLESVTAAGGAADGSSQQPRLSGDGRFLVFSTVAPNLTGAGLEPSARRCCGAIERPAPTTLVSHTPAGRPGHGWSGRADISDDGRYVVFESRATDLVAGPDANQGGSDIYLFDAADGTVRRVSVTDARRAVGLGPELDAGHQRRPAASSPSRRRRRSTRRRGRGRGADDPVRSVFRARPRDGATTRAQRGAGRRRAERRQLPSRHQRRRPPHRVRLDGHRPRRRRAGHRGRSTCISTTQTAGGCASSVAAPRAAPPTAPAGTRP